MRQDKVLQEFGMPGDRKFLRHQTQSQDSCKRLTMIVRGIHVVHEVLDKETRVEASLRAYGHRVICQVLLDNHVSSLNV